MNNIRSKIWWYAHRGHSHGNDKEIFAYNYFFPPIPFYGLDIHRYIIDNLI